MEYIIKAYIVFVYITQSKQHMNNISNKVFVLTSHLGDSGLKNNPTSCTRHGIAPGK